MTYCLPCRILANERLSDGFFLVKLEAPPIARDCSPGQFILLRGLVSEWPYLRRPFSIYASDGDSSIEIVYKVVGRATAAMSRMTEGDEFDVIGPLGVGFSLEDGFSEVIGLGGGIGVPPVIFYCQKYADAVERVSLIIGAATRAELLLPVGLVVQGVHIMPYTEDGSKGTTGTAVDGLKTMLDRSSVEPSSVRVIACGPKEMLSDAARLCRRSGIFCQVSVETMVACGVGACLSCAVPAAKGGYLHACKDGPVFESGLIDWERWLSW